ncbi:MAG TPA: serine hydrolase domain-containing protein [Acidimicrobiales bacterium]|nr:serine hydrolase domain-containing protein [Acidimicrobiales bacterium]
MGHGFDQERLSRISELCDRYVENGKFPCAQVQVARGDQIVMRHTIGKADIEENIDLRDDAIFRIYSMTKPLTSIGLMQLYEKGELILEDPVERFIPAFSDPQVLIGGSYLKPALRPAQTTLTVRDMLMHTSGLTYGFHFSNNLDKMYRKSKFGSIWGQKGDATETLEETANKLGEMPLLFDPGTSWNYSMSTDICGRLIEVISGQNLDEYLTKNITEPLGMVDTGFHVEKEKSHRFTSNYAITPENPLTKIDDASSSGYLEPARFLSGGGGMVSTTDDYQRFVSMLLKGGELQGERIIGRHTLEFMTKNHLPGGATLNDVGQSTFTETAMEGMGFGLGFSVLENPAANAALGSKGEFAWGGAASTRFWVDPVEEVTCIFMTQFMPSSYYPIRRELKATVYQALT